MSTRYLEDGSYMRLRNLTLAYTLPKSILKPISVENVRIFAQGLNLFTITNFRGLDPEIGTPTATGTAANGGALDFNYPASRSILFGLEVGF